MGFIDRFLVTAETFRIPSRLVFNKSDLWTEEAFEYTHELMETYEKLGYQCLYTSATEGVNIEKFESLLHHKTSSALRAFRSVGKSTLSQLRSDSRA